MGNDELAGKIKRVAGFKYRVEEDEFVKLLKSAMRGKVPLTFAYCEHSSKRNEKNVYFGADLKQSMGALFKEARRVYGGAKTTYGKIEFNVFDGCLEAQFVNCNFSTEAHLKPLKKLVTKATKLKSFRVVETQDDDPKADVSQGDPSAASQETEQETEAPSATEKEAKTIDTTLASRLQTIRERIKLVPRNYALKLKDSYTEVVKLVHTGDIQQVEVRAQKIEAALDKIEKAIEKIKRA